jgi:hypothetical protein
MSVTAIHRTAPRDIGHTGLLARCLHCVRRLRCVPQAGCKPAGLRVSERAWRRNSALLMSLYEERQDRMPHA